MVPEMWWTAATVIGSKIYVMLDQYAPSPGLKQFIVSAVTTHSGKSFHSRKGCIIGSAWSTVSSVSGSVLWSWCWKGALCLIDNVEILEYFNHIPPRAHLS